MSDVARDRDVADMADAVQAAQRGDALPGGLDAALLLATYRAAPPRPMRDGGSLHVGVEAVAHLVAARLLESPHGQDGA